MNALHEIERREPVFRIVWDGLGIRAATSAEPDISLTMISFWRLFVVAFSWRNRWIDICRTEKSA